ncbi:MAG: hypothetical protein D6739_07010, partial [Nitrospirae bacterium]
MILGSALPGLFAAIRLGMRGLRVLVVEEEAAARAHPAWREPFLPVGGGRGGVLDACLRELSLPLVERRRMPLDPLAYQYVSDRARIEVGELGLTAEEWVTWGLLKPDEARELLQLLAQASRREQAAMLEAPVVKTARLRGRGRPAPRERGLPVELRTLPPGVAPLLEDQLRAQHHLGEAPVPPEARARLYGSVLDGGVLRPEAGVYLREVLRARVRSVHGEFRSVSRRFELVEVASAPGIVLERPDEVWLGRALVINAPRHDLGRATADARGGISPLLDVPPPALRRATLHLRVHRDALPEGMGRRVVVGSEAAGGAPVAIQAFPLRRGETACEVVASTVAPAEPARLRGAVGRMEETVRALMPFSEGRMGRVRFEPPTWDHDLCLCDPPRGRGWPAEVELRLSSRPPVFHLPREEVAALG